MSDDGFTQDEVDEAVIQLMENDGSIESGWEYRDLVQHHRTFEGIIRALLNREFRDEEDEVKDEAND